MAPITIINPPSGFTSTLPHDFSVNKKLVVIGTMTNKRFDIDLLTGPSRDPRDSTALHVKIRLDSNEIVRNSYQNETWGTEESYGGMPIGPKSTFTVQIAVNPKSYGIEINGQPFCEYAHRLPHCSVRYFHVGGDAKVHLVSIE